ncbi:MAG TPA: hypothetical protein VK201_05395, partial [bacterium]|nr:hypothetical protein [bacterium]
SASILLGGLQSPKGVDISALWPAAYRNREPHRPNFLCNKEDIHEIPSAQVSDVNTQDVRHVLFT